MRWTGPRSSALAQSRKAVKHLECRTVVCRLTSEGERSNQLKARLKAEASADVNRELKGGGSLEIAVKKKSRMSATIDTLRRRCLASRSNSGSHVRVQIHTLWLLYSKRSLSKDDLGGDGLWKAAGQIDAGLAIWSFAKILWRWVWAIILR